MCPVQWKFGILTAQDKKFEILMPLCYFDFKEEEDKKLPYIYTHGFLSKLLSESESLNVFKLLRVPWPHTFTLSTLYRLKNTWKFEFVSIHYFE